jgi:hypothetical protein
MLIVVIVPNPVSLEQIEKKLAPKHNTNSKKYDSDIRSM